jgi:sigma-E factor negative regulatory protein RseA
MQDREPTDPARAALSALMDGDRSAADQACRAWRGDAAARDDWHTYHLIGDLLRSDEHRCEPARDAVFVARLRERLAAEPTVLAPQPADRVARAGLRPGRRLRAWMAPAAVAAGFVAVAGALVVTRDNGAEDGAVDRVAGAAVPAESVTRLSTTAGASPAPAQPSALPDNAALIRSGELDRYLAAHRQHANTFAPGVPRADMRNVSAEPGR